ncbi:MAG: tryptophan 2,3-dioxygenase family protein, partial [Planctomycetota bacterium]
RILDMTAEGVPLRDQLVEAMEKPSLMDVLNGFLSRMGCDIPKEVLDRDVREATAPSEDVQNELLKMYRERPDVSVMLELLTDIDEGIQEWRYRHVKLAERTIGAKIGTGGSDGVEFLKRTLFTPLFPDLWAIRSEM